MIPMSLMIRDLRLPSEAEKIGSNTEELLAASSFNHRAGSTVKS